MGDPSDCLPLGGPFVSTDTFPNSTIMFLTPALSFSSRNSHEDRGRSKLRSGVWCRQRRVAAIPSFNAFWVGSRDVIVYILKLPRRARQRGVTAEKMRRCTDL